MSKLITLDDINDIIEIFDDFLIERDVRIHSSDQSMIEDGGYTKETLHKNGTRIYGMDYGCLQGELLGLLEKMEAKGKIYGVVNSWNGEVEDWDMNLIDIKKLNAEVDKMIAEQDVTISMINQRTESNWKALWEEMVEDMYKYIGYVNEIGCEFTIDTDIQSIGYGKGAGNSSIGFRKECSHSVILYGNNGRCITAHLNLRREPDFTDSRIQHFLKNWQKQKLVFEQRFAEKCINEIREKAERANQRYEKAVRDLNESAV